MRNHFTIIGEIRHIETMAVGTAIRELARLEETYGKGRWRKRKGIASIQLRDGTICTAEVHWYEATGVGRREHKIKRFLDT